jgi:hypothetical protein
LSSGPKLRQIVVKRLFTNSHFVCRSF